MSASYITDSEGNVAYPKTLAKCVNKGGSTLEEYLNDVEDATLIKPTAQGTDIVLTDSSNMNIQELHLFGKTEQKTTKGINLLKTEQQDETRDGITITRNDDGTYVLNGTATIDVDFSLTSKFPAEKGKTYRMTGISKEKSGIFMYVTDGSTSYSCASGVGVTFTYTSESGKKYIHLLIPSGKTLNNITVKPMIVDGLTYPNTTYDDYEPYTGGIASPNPDYPQEIKSIENPTVSVAGKNLLVNNAKSKQIRNLIYTVNEDKSISVKGTYEVGKDVTESDIYLFGTFKDEGQYVYIPKGCYSINTISVPNGTYIAREKTKGSIINSENIIKTLSEQDCYFYSWVFRITKDGTYNSTIYPQMEVGNIATEYEPYKEIQSAQQTCKLNGIDDVRDELIVRADGTGQLIQRLLKEELNNNSDLRTWYETTKTYGYQTGESKWLFMANKINVKSNKLKGITKEVGNSGAYNENGIFVNTAGCINFKILKKYLTKYTVDALKTYLRDNPITVVGLLKEPIVNELSAEEVKKILAIHTNKPISTIWNDQNADMQITYVADAKNYIDNKFTELENSVCGGLLITDNLIDNSNMLNNTALTISDKISISSNSTYKTYLNIPVKAGESYYIGKSHRNSCIIDSIENKKVLQSNMVNQTDSYIFNVNYDGFLCVCFYTTEQNPKIALLTREKTES